MMDGGILKNFAQAQCLNAWLLNSNRLSKRLSGTISSMRSPDKGFNWHLEGGMETWNGKLEWEGELEIWNGNVE